MSSGCRVIRRVSPVTRRSLDFANTYISIVCHLISDWSIRVCTRISIAKPSKPVWRYTSYVYAQCIVAANNYLILTCAKYTFEICIRFARSYYFIPWINQQVCIWSPNAPVFRLYSLGLIFIGLQDISRLLSRMSSTRRLHTQSLYLLISTGRRIIYKDLLQYF